MKTKILILSAASTPLIISAISFYFVLQSYFINFENKAIEIGIPKGHSFFDFIDRQYSDIHFWFSLAILLNVILTVAVGYLLFRKLEEKQE